MSAKVTASTARKVIGSLGVVGAAAAVAGMGTFGSFTDSTTPVATTIQSGTLSIDLTQVATTAFTANGLVPGDTVTRTYNLKNDGQTDLGAVTLASTATASSILTSDTTNGLQLSVRSCGVAWTQGGTAAAPTFTCSSGERTMLSGPAVNSAPLTTPASLTAGASDYLAITFTLPASADNTFQNKTAGLSLTFSGVQRTAGAR
jgi:predicted ribosomally synthesized peptide with SipW-like signal peptide